MNTVTTLSCSLSNIFSSFPGEIFSKIVSIVAGKQGEDNRKDDK